MKTAVAVAAPWPYGSPGNLEAPPDELTFDVLVGRIARFARDGLLDMGARILWRPWQTDMRPAWDNPGFNVTEVYGPNIIGLAMMFCPASGIGAEEVDFRLLCWELYSLGSFAGSETGEAEAERQRIKNRWEQLFANTPFGQLSAEHVAQPVRGIWMAGRVRVNTHQAGVGVTDDVLRVALLHEAMADLAPDPHRFRQLLDTYFRNDVFRLLGHGLSLIAWALEAGPERCPGRFDVHEEDTAQTAVIDFAQFGSLACRPGSEFPPIGRELQALPEHERKLHPLSDPLSQRPGILLDDWTDRRAYCYPAPRRLLRSFRRLFIDDFVHFLPQEGGLEPPSLLGQALHRHLAEVLDGFALVIDDDDCPMKGKKPDAVWCGDRFGVVIEAKARLTPRTDPDCVAPDSLLVAWRRAWEAVEQADGFLRDPAAKNWIQKRTGRSPCVWVLAILVDERGVAERTQFRHATARWQLLSGTRLAGLALMTLECLEAAVRKQTPDTTARQIERAWTESGLNALNQPPEEPDLPSIDQPAYLQRASTLVAR